MKNFILAFILSAFAYNAYAQHTDSLTAKDYEHAAGFLSFDTQQFVDNGNVDPNWLTDDKFWYRNLTAQGSEFIVVDPLKGTRDAAFDHQKVAEAISKATGQKFEAHMLPFQKFRFADNYQ